jgi:pSer/pThr/pTyr-binding forkhead associated (FHA) protein
MSSRQSSKRRRKRLRRTWPRQRAPAPRARRRRGAPVANSGSVREGRLTTVDPVDPIPAEYALLRDEISLGRGEDNDLVIPHASVSRVHARLRRRDGGYELTRSQFHQRQLRQREGAAWLRDGGEWQRSALRRYPFRTPLLSRLAGKPEPVGRYEQGWMCCNFSGDGW